LHVIDRGHAGILANRTALTIDIKGHGLFGVAFHQDVMPKSVGHHLIYDGTGSDGMT
jgi:hypothetical protein